MAYSSDPSWTFQLADSPLRPVMSGEGLNRADNLRGDSAAIAALSRDSKAKALLFWRGKPLLVGADEASLRIAWVDMDDPLTAAATEPPIFLGLDGEAGRFALDVSGVDPESDPPAQVADRLFADLRGVASNLPAKDASIIAEGRSLLEWRRTHQFCARCGAKSAQAQGGWRRDCPACGATHFPRTDPVVIMVVARRGDDGVDRVVLGRQPNWPEGLYSLLAGYVEPGETIEAAVRRETLEEAGVRVGRVAYLASQPWPFPSTLMLGCYAEALSDELIPDFNELQDCIWVTKDEMRAAFAGEHQKINPPRRDAIAHTLARAWVDGLLD